MIVIMAFVLYLVLAAISVFLLFGLDIRYGTLGQDCDPNLWMVRLWKKKPLVEIPPCS